MKHFAVVAAVIEYQGKILCMQRGQAKYDYVSYKYEFPGGKIETGETNCEALMRELCEEMDIHVTIKETDYLLTVEHIYPDFAITMHTYFCQVQKPEFVRKEHVAHQWLLPSQMNKLDWAEADKPIVKFLKKKFSV